VDRSLNLAACEIAQVRMRALDGYELGGALVSAPRARPQRVAVIHPGAGIAALSYQRFATFLAQAGIPVLLYDYRGIGLSRPRSLRGFRATVEDWAQYDCAGATAWLRERFPEAPMLGIAHSIGALVVGGAANAAEQAQLVFIGGHTGYCGDYLERYRLPMTLLWHRLMPAMTRLFGYFPASRLGVGEDIPGGVALQWAARCSPDLRPSSAAPGEERIHRLLDRCATLQRPALLVSISDDGFAGTAGTRRLMAYYPRLFPLRQIVFTPADAGTRRLGHFGFFRGRAGGVLWPRLLAQLEPDVNTN
jgi:predicted alpha/beta hydrolase